MGLFDWVELETPERFLTPREYISYESSKQFQTKDLGCNLSMYKIDKNNNLLKLIDLGQYGAITDISVELAFSDGVENLEGWELHPFTGKVEIYSFIGLLPEGVSRHKAPLLKSDSLEVYWLELLFLFDKGVAVKVERVDTRNNLQSLV